MNSRILTITLSIGLLFAILALLPKLGGWKSLGVHTGYEPDQPIAFSHRLHAGELEVSCLYCHYGAQVSRHAGIPPLNVCMNCHRFISAPLGAILVEDKKAEEENREPLQLVSAEIGKLYAALGMDQSQKRDSSLTPKAVEWIKVYDLPDFAYFDHRPHLNAGVACQKCHGPVETMERVRVIEDLTMGWCVNCHRESNKIGIAGKQVDASIDCSVCHY